MMHLSAAARRERRCICVHEAAHAVVAIIKGGQASVRLIIRRDADDFLFFSGCVTERRCTRNPLVAAAGFVAEEKYCAARGWSVCDEASETDMKNVDEAVGQDQAGMYSERTLALERARATLDDPEVWFAGHTCLADALMGCWPDAVGPGEFVGEMSAAAVAATCGLAHA